MPDQIGNITVPEIIPNGTFPIVSDYAHGRASHPDVAIHQFGSGSAKIEQRFLLGARATVHGAAVLDERHPAHRAPELFGNRNTGRTARSPTTRPTTTAASFTFGNANRVMREPANDVDLYRAAIEFPLFHVGQGIKLDLWKGDVVNWSLDAGPEFKLTVSDGLYELNLPYPTRKISRTCWKAFNSRACPYATAGALDLVHFGMENGRKQRIHAMKIPRNAIHGTAPVRAAGSRHTAKPADSISDPSAAVNATAIHWSAARIYAHIGSSASCSSLQPAGFPRRTRLSPPP